MAVAVITDSQCCIPTHLAEELGITVLPFTLQMDGTLYRDGVDLTPQEFYELLPRLSQPATTSAVSPGAFLEALGELSREADGVLIVTISSTMSATYNNARLAAESFRDLRVEVLDSRTAAMAQGLAVLEVARAARRGASLEECLRQGRELCDSAELFAYISTFEYLRKSGRVNAVTALAAEALSIKPVFRFKDGEAVLAARKRSPDKARRFISARVREYHELRGPLSVAVFHASALEEAEELADLIRDGVETREEIIISQFTPVMGCHTGPGVVGAAFI